MLESNEIIRFRLEPTPTKLLESNFDDLLPLKRSFFHMLLVIEQCASMFRFAFIFTCSSFQFSFSHSCLHSFVVSSKTHKWLTKPISVGWWKHNCWNNSFQYNDCEIVSLQYYMWCDVMFTFVIHFARSIYEIKCDDNTRNWSIYEIRTYYKYIPYNACVK